MYIIFCIDHSFLLLFLLLYTINPGGELNLVDWRFYRHAINFKSASDKLLCLCKKEAYISFYVSKNITAVSRTLLRTSFYVKAVLYAKAHVSAIPIPRECTD